MIDVSDAVRELLDKYRETQDRIKEQDAEIARLRDQIATVRNAALREVGDIDFGWLMNEAETCMSGNRSRAEIVHDAVRALIDTPPQPEETPFVQAFNRGLDGMMDDIAEAFGKGGSDTPPQPSQGGDVESKGETHVIATQRRLRRGAKRMKRENGA